MIIENLLRVQIVQAVQPLRSVQDVAEQSRSPEQKSKTPNSRSLSASSRFAIAVFYKVFKVLPQVGLDFRRFERLEHFERVERFVRSLRYARHTPP
jgi:hypothetical protein